MTDESNGESTFEFVEKKVDEVSIISDEGKTDSISNFSASASPVPVSLNDSASTENLLSNIAPPSALPSFVTKFSKVLISKERTASQEEAEKNDEVVRKQPQANPEIHTKSQTECAEVILEEQEENTAESEQDSSSTGASYLVSRVLGKAVGGFNFMITTLNPHVRQLIYSGSDVNIIVASNKEVKVSPIREAFQSVFDKATVTGVAVESTAVAEQLVGFAAGIKGAKERIKAARQLPNLSKDAPIVAVENFLLEVGINKWYDLGVIILNDPENKIILQTFTQMTPVPSQIVAVARESTPNDYPLKWSGFSVTIDSLMRTSLQISHNEWHHAFTGVSRRDIIHLAAQTLAGIYKNTVQESNLKK